jgi:hypothetical protein
MKKYKVIADYPSSPYQIGDMVEIVNNHALITVTNESDPWNLDLRKVRRSAPVSLLDKYPALFKEVNTQDEIESMFSIFFNNELGQFEFTPCSTAYPSFTVPYHKHPTLESACAVVWNSINEDLGFL